MSAPCSKSRVKPWQQRHLRKLFGVASYARYPGVIVIEVKATVSFEAGADEWQRDPMAIIRAFRQKVIDGIDADIRTAEAIVAATSERKYLSEKLNEVMRRVYVKP